MTGPLAPLFAQVWETLDFRCPHLLGERCNCVIPDGRAALSSIERHVQDMEKWERIAKDWRYSNEFLGGVVRQKWPVESPRAALPASGTRNRVAREKEEK